VKQVPVDQFTSIQTLKAIAIFPSHRAQTMTEPPISIEELQEKLVSLEQLAAVGELSSTVTHEFNNILMTILNYAQLGIRQKDPATRDKAFQKIHESAVRASKITATVLSLSRSGSAENSVARLDALIKDALVLLAREMQKYRIFVETQLEEVPPAAIEPSKFQRVLLNLLTNARQAIGERGTITIKLSYDSQSSNVVCVVRDTGAGIPAQVLPKIFDRFFTTKSGPDNSGKGGTGLGLSMCREIIEQCDGRIRVESSIGKGTAFTIRLPIARIEPKEIKRPA
jgi:signal transduction histidine kinase